MMESKIRANHSTGKVVWTLDPDIAEVYASEIARLARRDPNHTDVGFADDASALLEGVEELRDFD